MKATLEFNLPEDSSEHRLTLAAGELHAALCDIRDALRSRLKHNRNPPKVVAELESLRELIPHELLDRL